MKIEKIIEILDAKIVCGNSHFDDDINVGFSSDLMSDVLTIHTDDNVLLLTGLCNIQTIRTAEMSDISIVVFVRGKKATGEMLELAEENSIILLETNFSMFKAAGILYENGISPVY